MVVVFQNVALVRNDMLYVSSVFCVCRRLSISYERILHRVTEGAKVAQRNLEWTVG